MMMPLIAMTAFLKTDVVFAALGVLRWLASVTVTTGSKLGAPGVCGQVNTG